MASEYGACRRHGAVHRQDCDACTIVALKSNLAAARQEAQQMRQERDGKVKDCAVLMEVNDGLKARVRSAEAARDALRGALEEVTYCLESDHIETLDSGCCNEGPCGWACAIAHAEVRLGRAALRAGA